MKTIITILLLISMYESKSQLNIDESKTSYPVIGFSTGYSLSNGVNAGLQFGYRADNLYLNGDMIIPLTSSVFAPKIFTGSIGYNNGSFQGFISCGYHTIGGESEQYYKGTENEFINGFRFGGGIRYYPKTIPLSFTAQRQGKENILSVTLYKAL